MKRLTIYDIKRLTSETNPHFFDSKKLKFFGQTLKSFSIRKQPDGRFRISVPIVGTVHHTVRYFNPLNNQLERE